MAFDLFSTMFFWFLYAMTGYWFIFFKFQERVFVLMPDLDSYKLNYRPYDGMLGTVAICKFLSLGFKIAFEQSDLDIFFIDWESPKLYSHGRYAAK